MSFDDTDVITRLHSLAEGFEMPASLPTEDLGRGRLRARRNRRVWAGATAAALALILAVTAAVSAQIRGSRPGPVEPPRIAVHDVPVWFDANGLHRGDVVEKAAVDITAQGDPPVGALALVRTGALYLDPATHDVWFHPWGGHPRVVGHHSYAGPGGDPNGDTAAWFERSDLVVYDTATGRQISRTTETGTGATSLLGDHRPPGNSFVQVSAERVSWLDRGIWTHDLRTGTTTSVPTAASPVDAHDGITVSDAPPHDTGTLVLRVPGTADRRYPQLEGTRGRLSPNGQYLLAVQDQHAAAIVDTKTGEVWVPRGGYPWIAWSYDDVAMVDFEDALLACDAARRTCETLPAKRPFLMPTN